MYTLQMLRALVNERLTTAVEDIFRVLGKTIDEYEEEVSRSKEEISRQRKLLEAILNPHIRLNRADLQQSFVCKEGVVREQQEWSPSLGQEEPDPPHIKEEPEELIQGLEEAEVPTLTLLPDKSENNEEEHSSQLNPTQTEDNREAELPASTSTEQMKTEPDGENCRVSEPASDSDLAGDLEPASDGQLLSSDCCETKTEDSGDDSKETREPQSGLNTLKSKKTRRVEGQNLSVSNKIRRSMEQSNEPKPSTQIPSLVCCKVCGKSFSSKKSLGRHVLVHSRDCGFCGKHLDPTESLKLHLQAHRTCNVCSKKCNSISKLAKHMHVHTRKKHLSCIVCEKGFKCMSHNQEKPFSCSLCGNRFVRREHLHRHMRLHTGEKPFSCSVCSKTFAQKGHLQGHMRLHTGEKPFSCSVCCKRFGKKGNRNAHMRVHTGEKPFSCSICSKGFSEKGNLKSHMRVHTGEKPYSCSDCGKCFTWQSDIRSHKCASENSSR